MEQLGNKDLVTWGWEEWISAKGRQVEVYNLSHLCFLLHRDMDKRQPCLSLLSCFCPKLIAFPHAFPP